MMQFRYGVTASKMSYSKKIKNFFIKYWEILVAAALVAVGFVLGTSGNRENVLKKDKEAQKKAADEIKEGTDKAIETFKNTQKENQKIKQDSEKSANSKAAEREKELLKDSEKLDKVLKEKYKLNKG